MQTPNFAHAMEREGQTIFLQWVRALIAVSGFSVMCYCEVSGIEISETFAMLMGIVVGLYFEKGSMSLRPAGEPEKPAGEPTQEKKEALETLEG
jgi:hypothetical protein